MIIKISTSHKEVRMIDKQTHSSGKEVVMTNLVHNKKNGFTLVELMIVIVIVGVLAAIAVPIYTSNVKRAKMSEADASLGTIRTQLRVYYAEYGDYPATSGNVVGATWNNIQASQLDGKYFPNTAYTYTGTDSTYTITCAASGVLDSDRAMNQAGALTGGI